MNGYICFYNGEQYEVYSDTLYDAKLKAVEYFKVTKKNAYKVTAHLAEKNNIPVVHTAVN